VGADRLFRERGDDPDAVDDVVLDARVLAAGRPR
jgi:hypothetical protein